MATARSKQSAGLLLWRRTPPADPSADPGAETSTGVEVMLVHPGGPFWAKKDEGAWSIPKGEHGPDEEPAVAAAREFAEELGVAAPPGPHHDLGEIRQKAGKVVRGYACEGDLDVGTVVSNTFEMEWPPRSGRMQSFPEVDRAAWFALAEAGVRINGGQRPLLDRLAEHVRTTAAPPP